MPPPTPIAASPQSNRLGASVTRTMVGARGGAVATASPADAVEGESRLGWADETGEAASATAIATARPAVRR